MEKTKRVPRMPKAGLTPLDYKFDTESVAKRLEEYRVASGLRLVDLVDLTGIGRDTISRLLYPPPNKTIIPDITTIFKVCDALSHKGVIVDYNYVFRGAKNKQDETIQKCIEMLNSIISYRDGVFNINSVADNSNDRILKFHTGMSLSNNTALCFSVCSLSYKTLEDEYIILKGNINRIVKGEIYHAVKLDNECLMNYDFVERLKSQYRKKRPFFGNISILSINEFVWLSIMASLAEKTIAV